MSGLGFGRARRGWRPLVAALALTLVGGSGRNAPVGVESRAEVRLAPGQVFRFVDRFRGGAAPSELPRGSDGRVQVQLGGAREPALCAPVPHVFRQALSLPAGARFRTAFGMSPGRRNPEFSRIRFTVRLRRNGKIAELLSEEVGRWAGGRGPAWTPVTFDLPPGEVELYLITEAAGDVRPASPAAPGAACAVWVNPIVLAPAEAPPPNILLVLVDDLRPDHLGCYGYQRHTSPFLDSLAARGVLFEDANSQATWTFASVRGMLTSAHRFASFAPDVSAPPSPTAGDRPRSEPVTIVTSLQGELRKAGYETMACVGGGYLDPRFGCDAGFDWYWSPTTTPALADQISAVRERLQEIKPKPFFFFLHTYEVHQYRDGWGHGLDRFGHRYAGRLRDSRRLRQALEEDPHDLDPADLTYIGDLYDGEIWHTDRQLRSFVDWLSAEPWARDMIVVVVADHGEAFGEHGLMRHGGPPYRELTHVPFILYRSDGRWGGRRIRQAASLVDLAPTLLELAGVPQPSEMVGETLRPLIEGVPGGARPMLCGGGNALMARDGPWWYMSWRGTRPDELYNLASDPEQERNLAGSERGALAKMRMVLAELAMQAAHGYHLAVVGRQRGTAVITVTSTAGFSYFDVPTLRASDRVEVQPIASGQTHAPAARNVSEQQSVRIVLAAGDEPQVILFEPAKPGATVRVEARTEAGPVEAGRFHLGRSGISPRGVPVVIEPAARVSLASDHPPVRASAETWGLWLWRPSGPAPPAQPQLSEPERLPENLKRQMKSLGYLK